MSLVLKYDTNKRIEIKRGQTYFNQTLRFLTPSLTVYDSLVDYLLPLQTLAWTIGDHNYSQDIKNHLHAVIDVNGRYKYDRYLDKKTGYKDFYSFIEFIKNQDYYVDDYTFNDYAHVVIFNIHEMFGNLIDKFIEGKYSQLYTEKHLKMGVISKKIKIRGKYIESVPYKIITRDKEYRKEFFKKLNTDFKSKVDPFDKDIINDDRELEYKPFLKQEILNYNL